MNKNIHKRQCRWFGRLARIAGRAVAAAVITAAVAACGDSDTWTVEGTVEGAPNTNLRYIYEANGRVNSGLTAVRDGKFEFKGVAAAPTVVELTDNDYRPMGRVYVANGERLRCVLTPGRPEAMKVTGNDVSERWARMLNDNASLAASPAAMNAAIAAYVEAHPADIVSTLLMVTAYDAAGDAAGADRLIALIDPAVRPGALTDGINWMLQRLLSVEAADTLGAVTGLNLRDSLVTAAPDGRRMTLVAVSDGESGRGDSITGVLRQLGDRKTARRLQTVDISVDRDTASWHRSVRSDSATWTQLWVAASVVSPTVARLGVPSLPYFIVADTAGVQRLRTTSVTAAKAWLDSCLAAGDEPEKKTGQHP